MGHRTVHWRADFVDARHVLPDGWRRPAEEEMTIPSWNKAKIPPCWCRVLAKCTGKDGKPRLMTNAELASRTGWEKQYLESIYQRATWTKVKVGDMELFLWACGLHPAKQRRYVEQLRRICKKGMDGIRNLRHLRGRAIWQVRQRETLLRMVERVLENEQRGGGVETGNRTGP